MGMHEGQGARMERIEKVLEHYDLADWEAGPKGVCFFFISAAGSTDCSVWASAS